MEMAGTGSLRRTAGYDKKRLTGYNPARRYETIVKAHEGDPEAVNAVLSHYAGYIRYFSKVHGQVNAEVEEYVKQQLIAALFKFRFDR